MKEKKIQLYSLATPNGQKASIALEEMQIPYDAHRIDIREGDQFTDAYVKINPNSKIPAIVDPNGPDGEPLTIMESGAILIYLAEKSGQFLSQDPRIKSETLQWLFFQVGHVGPMFGQFGHFFVFAKDTCEHPYPIERYTKETKRLLTVLDRRLEGRDCLVGEAYSIADIATVPWVNCLVNFYKASDVLGIESFKNVERWRALCNDRPAVKVGAVVCPV
ncbi:MAG: glutathione S-transferase N-terminal domain-containing protein [Candidatus Margulisbacteria bacterium]|nr:glutathione S-transferase N-terminal domain-containing protein [Candidatus Margulisiibacteriota bacterium]